MNMSRFFTRLLVICEVMAVTLKLFDKTVSPKINSNSVSYDEVDAYVQQQMDRLRIPGVSLAIVEGDKIVYLRSFGQAHPDGEAPSPQTPFFIGSLTKSFTALAMMQLVEAGKIDLDASVLHYLPWFQVADPLASAQITVRHLVNQTSGLTEWSGRIPLADFNNSPDATERQARALATLVLNRPVGSAFEYSNSNYNLLGLIIEAASGEPYADYVQNHIFIPLDMNHSYISQVVAKQNGLAVGHQYWFAVPIAVPSLPIPHGSLPSGQLISCAEDMARYLIAHLNGGRYGNVQILSPTGVNEMQHGVAEYIEMGISFGKYGMGWIVDDIDQTKIAWHTGIVPDFFSYMALLPEQKKGVILFFNAYHYLMTPALTEFGAGVAALLAGQKPAPSQFGFTPWVLRAFLLIPAIQIVGVAATLRRLRHWRQDPMSRPRGGSMWGLHILLPLIPNLLITLILIPILGVMRGFWMLFMPDLSWIAMVCGGFAGIWAFLRTGLILRAIRKPQVSKPSLGGSEHIR